MMKSRGRFKNKKPFRPSAALVLEGDTERWYFQLLQQHEKSLSLHLKPEIPQKKKLADQYEKVDELANQGYDFVFWIVDFDEILKQTREASGKYKTPLVRFNEYKAMLKSKYPHVFVIVNAPCLEFWIYLHFVCTSRFFTDCNSVIQEMKKMMPGYEKTEKFYRKKGNDIYAKLKEKQHVAIKNAILTSGFDNENPYRGVSEMNILFQKLGLYEEKQDGGTKH